MQDFPSPQLRLLCHKFSIHGRKESSAELENSVSSHGTRAKPLQLRRHGILRRHPFNTRIQVTLIGHPQREGRNDDGSFFSEPFPFPSYRGRISLSRLCSEDFLNAYLRNPDRTLYLYSTGTPPGVANSVSIAGDRILRLSVDRETFQGLGLDGEILPFRPHGKWFTLDLDLGAPGFRPGGKVYQRALFSFQSSRISDIEVVMYCYDHRLKGNCDIRFHSSERQNEKQSSSSSAAEDEGKEEELIRCSPNISHRPIPIHEIGKIPNFESIYEDFQESMSRTRDQNIHPSRGDGRSSLDSEEEDEDDFKDGRESTAEEDEGVKKEVADHSPPKSWLQTWDWLGMLACREWHLLQSVAQTIPAHRMIQELCSAIPWKSQPSVEAEQGRSGGRREKKRLKRASRAKEEERDEGSIAADSFELTSNGGFPPALPARCLGFLREKVDAGEAEFGILHVWGEQRVSRAWGAPEQRIHPRWHRLGSQGEAENDFVYIVLPQGRYMLFVGISEDEHGL